MSEVFDYNICSDYDTFLVKSGTAISNIASTTFLNVGEDRFDTYTSNCNTLDEYADGAFRVGNSNAFSTIVDEFCGTINNVKEQVDTYLTEADSCKGKIMECKMIDDEARRKAQDAYNSVMNMPDTSPEFQVGTGEYKEENGKKVEITRYDSGLRYSKAIDDWYLAWRKNNCYLWNDD